MEKREELYRGKAKSVYTTDDPDRLVLLFRNDTSAFDGKRIEQLDRKGMVNNKFNAFIMQKLEAAGIPTQFDKLLADNEVLVKKLAMIPVECVVRNYAAGSLVRRLGVGMMRIWPELPPDLKQKVLTEAHTAWDREFHVSHLDDKLEAILKRFGARARP